jgi:hypothetical protein
MYLHDKKKKVHIAQLLRSVSVCTDLFPKQTTTEL